MNWRCSLILILDFSNAQDFKSLFSLLHGVLTGSDVKQSGREADHSPPSSVEVKNAGAIPQLLPYVFMA
jgi:hypothetical protein